MSELIGSIGLPPQKLGDQPCPPELQEYLDRLRRAVRELEQELKLYVTEQIEIAAGSDIVFGVRGNIDLTADESEVTLYEVPEGVTIAVLGCYAYCQDVDSGSGSIAVSNFNIGTNSPNYNNVLTGVTLSAQSDTEFSVLGGGDANGDVLGADRVGPCTLKARVTDAATHPTCQIDIVVHIVAFQTEYVAP